MKIKGIKVPKSKILLRPHFSSEIIQTFFAMSHLQDVASYKSLKSEKQKPATMASTVVLFFPKAVLFFRLSLRNMCLLEAYGRVVWLKCTVSIYKCKSSGYYPLESTYICNSSWIPSRLTLRSQFCRFQRKPELSVGDCNEDNFQWPLWKGQLSYITFRWG